MERQRHVECNSDEQLMAQVMRGDRGALATLVERYYGAILGYLYRLAQGNRPLAEDLTQETFLALLRQGSYVPTRSFKPWLYAVATNLVRDHFKAATTRRTDWGQENALLALHDPTPGPEALAEASEQGVVVARALTQLGPEYRATVILRFYQGLSLQEIAETLGVPLGTVKSRLSVGTHRLRELLTNASEGALP